jgi:hypothetical protein
MIPMLEDNFLLGEEDTLSTASTRTPSVAPSIGSSSSTPAQSPREQRQ